MSWGQWFLGVVLILVCGFLMLVILLQRGRGGGLAGAFGGGGGGGGAFGAKTGDILTWITVAMTAVFIVLAVVSNFAFDQSPASAAEKAAKAASEAVPTESAPVPAAEGESSTQNTSEASGKPDAIPVLPAAGEDSGSQSQTKPVPGGTGGGDKPVGVDDQTGGATGDATSPVTKPEGKNQTASPPPPSALNDQKAPAQEAPPPSGDEGRPNP